MCALSVTCILSTLQNPIHVMSTNCVLYFMPTLISIALFKRSTGLYSSGVQGKRLK